jgi:hypothetical protein
LSRSNKDAWPKAKPEEKKPVSYNAETNKTVALYLINLVSMILMCILVVGILIITLIIWLEGSLLVDPVIFVHLTIPCYVLILNLYVIMSDDQEEERFFKNSKKSGSGKGVFLVNFALLASFCALALTAYLKFVVGTNSARATFQPSDAADLYESDYEDGQSGGNSQSDNFLFIEECIMHALGVVEAVTLREYAKAKMKDISNFKKKK